MPRKNQSQPPQGEKILTRPMEEVIVTDKNDNPIATGRAFLVPFEIRQMKKGMAVKVRSGSSDE